MKRIKLSNANEYANVDDEDFTALSVYNWRLTKSRNQKYAVRSAYVSELIDGKKKDIRMHNQIMNTPEGFEVDHIDRNGLNNCRYNLRICTHQQNSYNTRSAVNSKSKYKGVAWHKGNKMWQANITIGGKQLSLGYSKDEKEAARKYDEAAKKYYRNFAVLNFPQK